MATTFLEPGGDATFNVNTITAGSFWKTLTGTPTIATDFVHGNHIKSLKFSPNSNQAVLSPNSVVADAGARVSFYIYIVALSDFQNNGFFEVRIVDGGGDNFLLQFKNDGSGKIQLMDGTSSTQLAISSSGLTTGAWYRICVAYTITDTTHNRIEIFVNGTSFISATNVTLSNTGSSTIKFGNIGSDDLQDFRLSDIYVDNSSSLTDTGDVWVTAKRPNANGTANNFTTQIGSGGSGYGTGHSPQVNERALSTTNGWSMVGAGSAVTEEYNIESKSTGDINIVGTIIDYLGWAYLSSLVAETVQIILGGVNFAQAITSTNTMYTKVAGSATYPVSTGADIGVTTDTSLTTVSLFECGIMVAYTPSVRIGTVGPFPTHYRGNP